MQTSSHRTKVVLIKEMFGNNSNTQGPMATFGKNIIMPASSIISHKYSFILEALININNKFSVADYSTTNGLFACLLAQDFEISMCYVVTKKKKELALHKKLKDTFKRKNLKTRTATIKTTKLKTDISIHDNATLALLNNTKPEKLAQYIASTTTKYTIIDISNTKDPELQKKLKNNLGLVQVFFNHLLEHYWIITFIPIIYSENTIRACYLLEKR